MPLETEEIVTRARLDATDFQAAADSIVRRTGAMKAAAETFGHEASRSTALQTHELQVLARHTNILASAIGELRFGAVAGLEGIVLQLSNVTEGLGATGGAFAGMAAMAAPALAVISAGFVAVRATMALVAESREELTRTRRAADAADERDADETAATLLRDQAEFATQERARIEREAEQWRHSQALLTVSIPVMPWDMTPEREALIRHGEQLRAEAADAEKERLAELAKAQADYEEFIRGSVANIAAFYAKVPPPPRELVELGFQPVPRTAEQADAARKGLAADAEAMQLVERAAPSAGQAVASLEKDFGKLTPELTAGEAAMKGFAESTKAAGDMMADAGREFAKGAASIAMDRLIGASVRYVAATKAQRDAQKAMALTTSEAMQAMLRDTLKSLATRALAESLFQMGVGFAHLAIPDPKGASEAFTSAGVFAAVAAMAGGAAAAIPAVVKQMPGGADTGTAAGAAAGGGGAGFGGAGAGGAGEAPPVVINVNVPPGGEGAAGEAIIRAIDRYQRERGGARTFT